MHTEKFPNCWGFNPPKCYRLQAITKSILFTFPGWTRVPKSSFFPTSQLWSWRYCHVLRIAMYCHIASLTICCKRARMSSSANGHDDSSVKQCQANKWRMWHLMAMAAMLPRNLHITIYHNIQIKSCHNMSQPATASGPLRFDHLWISFWSLNPFDQSLICVVHLAPRCAVRQNLRAVSSRPKAQRPQAWPLWNLEILGTWNISEKNQTY